MNLDAGQVWELSNNNMMVLAMLIKFHERAGGEWDCLSLHDGIVFSASLARWQGGSVFASLVGKRIA